MDFDLEKAIEILSQTPQTVTSLLGNLSDEWTMSRNGGNEWNPFDVIGHYIHGEETDWIPRAAIILARGGNPAFEPFDRFAQFESSRGRTLTELLRTFSALRRKNLQTLRSWNLTAEDLRLTGIHPAFGVVTLEQLLAAWVVHDLTHLRQIVTVLARNYTDEAGPWRAYLSILQA
jgi:hypothetical protein